MIQSKEAAELTNDHEVGQAGAREPSAAWIDLKRTTCWRYRQQLLVELQRLKAGKGLLFAKF